MAGGILDAAKVRDVTPVEVWHVHAEARARATAGVRPIDKLADDVFAQSKRRLKQPWSYPQLTTEQKRQAAA